MRLEHILEGAARALGFLAAFFYLFANIFNASRCFLRPLLNLIKVLDNMVRACFRIGFHGIPRPCKRLLLIVSKFPVHAGNLHCPLFLTQGIVCTNRFDLGVCGLVACWELLKRIFVICILKRLFDIIGGLCCRLRRFYEKPLNLVSAFLHALRIKLRID